MKKSHRKAPVRRLEEGLSEVKGGTRATIIDTGSGEPPPPPPPPENQAGG